MVVTRAQQHEVRDRIERDLTAAAGASPLRALKPIAGPLGRAFGWIFRVCFTNRLGRWFFRGPYARFAAWFWPRVLGMRRSDDPVIVAANYMRYGSVLGAIDVRVGANSTPERVEVIFPYCPFGLHDRHARVCDDSVCTDKAIARAVGGHLEIPDTVAKGAEQCTFVFTRPSQAAAPFAA